MPEANPYLADVEALRAELERLRAAIAAALDELRVPNGAAEIVNAIDVLEAALK